jgi:hypothetical protein
MKDKKLNNVVLDLTSEDIESAVREWISARTTAQIVGVDLFSDDKGIRGTATFELPPKR